MFNFNLVSEGVQFRVEARSFNCFRAFFNGTAVECVLVGRAKVEGVLASEFVGTCYTHHQKTVICDAPLDDGSDRRRIIGRFVKVR
jgi:hypothetical protein